MGEEENGDLCSESQAPVSQPKKQHGRRREQDAMTDAPDEGKRELRDNSKEGRAGATFFPLGGLCLQLHYFPVLNQTRFAYLNMLRPLTLKTMQTQTGEGNIECLKCF